jgi:hypothetical protein
LSTNWSDIILKNSLHPKTVDETVELLINILEDKDMIQLADINTDKLIDLHYGLGLSIRNGFGLYDAHSKQLLHDCGSDNADDASPSIIKALSARLKQEGWGRENRGHSSFYS